MSVRKLKALNYPKADTFNKNDTHDFRRLIMWLEEEIIKALNIKDRQLSCPIISKTESEQLEWILGFAVRIEYKKNKETFRAATPKNMKNGTPNITYANVLDNLDFHSAEVKSGIHSLAEIIKIPKHPDHLIMLTAIRKIVCTRLSTEALQNPEKVIVKGTPFPYEEYMKTDNFGDPAVNRAVKILRLLYTKNLEQLQDDINEIITAVQLITAPREVYIKLHK